MPGDFHAKQLGSTGSHTISGVRGIGAAVSQRMGAFAASGPRVARVFHSALALVFAGAFLSLGVQVDVLIGSRGILPLAPLVEALGAREDVGFLDFPTLFWLVTSDGAIAAGIWLGIALALAAFAGLWPRVCFALLVPLYLSYAVACRDLLSFQWDNLLLECGFLAVFLPRDRPAVWIHFLFRLVLFKLYFESGIAKWQSPLGDWQDGSAMSLYYETAPLPTALAWYSHYLPAAWHTFESWAALVLEGLVPFLIFGPRRARWVALLALSGFQLVNLATANYGFFCFLALVLHLFLLDDRDFARVPAWPWERKRPRAPGPTFAGLAAFGTAALVFVFVVGSFVEAAAGFSRWHWPATLAPARALYQPFRIINTYHLFGHITEERIEPEFQTFDGELWTAHALRYKPGPLDRAPPFVAPHQPRVDFRLWFYGLSYARRTPSFVTGLLQKLCRDPAAVRSLFSEPLPSSPRAVRIVFARYRYSEPGEGDAYWTRDWRGATPSIPCEGDE